ncbi:hypothetical protein ACFYNX_26365 [Streptomyces sp. NPDC007872]|uniref:hypothetical protein n=1 Tax=Streptomyces sp. NPDC007872 TaxID=3364782 RepID=UPI0036CE6CB2
MAIITMKRTPAVKIPHAEFQVDGQRFRVDELVWHNTSGRSFDLVHCDTDEVLTLDESFDKYPTDEQVASVLEEHGFDPEMEMCWFCKKVILQATAHRVDQVWVGDSCCWDDRLR